MLLTCAVTASRRMKGAAVWGPRTPPVSRHVPVRPDRDGYRQGYEKAGVNVHGHAAYGSGTMMHAGMTQVQLS